MLRERDGFEFVNIAASPREMGTGLQLYHLGWSHIDFTTNASSRLISVKSSPAKARGGWLGIAGVVLRVYWGSAVQCLA